VKNKIAVAAMKRLLNQQPQNKKSKPYDLLALPHNTSKTYFESQASLDE
jgi:hypothetical protein